MRLRCARCAQSSVGVRRSADETRTKDEAGRIRSSTVHGDDPAIRRTYAWNGSAFRTIAAEDRVSRPDHVSRPLRIRTGILWAPRRQRVERRGWKPHWTSAASRIPPFQLVPPHLPTASVGQVFRSPPVSNGTLERGFAHA